MDEKQKEELSKLLNNAVQWDHPLKEYTSFHIGGPAEALTQVHNRELLQRLLQYLADGGIQWRVIGRGTNLLVGDSGYPGVVIILTEEMKELSITQNKDEVWVEVGAGLSLTKLARCCQENGFSGLEFTMGIPGTVGGAVVMNAGAWESCMADVVDRVNIMTHQGEKRIVKEDLKFAYRKCLNIQNQTSGVVTSARLCLQHGDPAEMRKIYRRNLEKRKKSQPVEQRNAGSIFKNPPGDSAGRLIEASGCKGKKIGGAKVSEKHANFIVNTGSATAADVLELMTYIQENVHRDSGVLLEPEVHIL